MNENELKPCPFCGGKAKYTYEKGMALVRCTNSFTCGATGRAVPVSDSYRAKEVAIAAWERRATDEG